MEQIIAEESPKYKLLKVESLVMLCDCCGRWLDRFPAFMGWEGEPDCECGCTSVKFEEGRPYGPKSKIWPQIEKYFNELWRHIDEPELVTTEPPFAIESIRG